MDIKKVNSYLLQNHKFFPEEKLLQIRDMLIRLPEDKFMAISTIELKDPTMLLVISIFAGQLGIDRFLIGDIGMGVLKLLTMGCCGILSIIDLFKIQDLTKEHNFSALLNCINMFGTFNVPPMGFSAPNETTAPPTQGY